MSARFALLSGLFLALALFCQPVAAANAQEMPFESLKFEGQDAPPMPQALSPATPPERGSGGTTVRGVKPSASVAITAPDEIRLTPDQSQVLTLTRDVASVVVSNPAHASVFLDSPRTLIITPRAEGSTNFKALDYRGQIILEKQIVVTGRTDHYVRIRRNCAEGADCAATEVFYCPNGCHHVAMESLSTAASGGVAGTDIDAPAGSGGGDAPAAGDAAGGTDGASGSQTPSDTGGEEEGGGE